MIYLDNAATSYPKPSTVCDEMLRCMKFYCANPGRSGHKMSLTASEKIYECRENLSQLFNIANPLNIVFTSNATEGLNIGIKGILKPKDHVIISSLEHNSVVRPIQKLMKSEVSCSIVPINTNKAFDTNNILQKIRENTKLIVVTHASNVTGQILPIKRIGKIAKEKNIIFMVDAAQTAGCHHIDVQEQNIDILVFPGHKGLFGPQGTGGIYIKEGLELDSLKEGGTGSYSESISQPQILPDKMESGTLNTPGIVGLNEGVKYILKNGIDEIIKRERELIEYFLNGLKEINNVTIYGNNGLDNRTGTVSINIGNIDCMLVSHELDKRYDIMARSGLHCSYLAHKTIGTVNKGTVRFSLNCLNSYRHVQKALLAIKNISEGKIT